jgi:hypothetical protein
LARSGDCIGSKHRLARSGDCIGSKHRLARPGDCIGSKHRLARSGDCIGSKHRLARSGDRDWVQRHAGKLPASPDQTCHPSKTGHRSSQWSLSLFKTRLNPAKLSNWKKSEFGANDLDEIPASPGAGIFGKFKKTVCASLDTPARCVHF